VKVRRTDLRYSATSIVNDERRAKGRVLDAHFGVV
jgi:hypothetical protein